MTILTPLFVFPIIFMDDDRRITLVTILCMVAYLACVYPFKSAEVYADEFSNAILFTVFGCLIGYFNRRMLRQNVAMIEKLRQSEEQYQIAAKDSNNMLCKYDVQNKILTMNAYVASYLSVSTTVENVPDDPDTLQLITPACQDTFRGFFNAMRAGTPKGSIELQMKTSKGLRWLEAHYTTVFANDGRPAYAVVSFSDITERKLKDALTKMLIEHDGLTHTYNRDAFIKKVKYEMEADPDGAAAICLLDVDNFKTVNDTLGHQMGDEVLVQIGEDLHGILREHDVVGRIGGDEFMLYMPNIQGDALSRKAGTIVRSIYRLLENQVPVSISMGVAARPQNGRTFEELYRCSDLALYQAKRGGRNQFVLYDEKFEETTAAGRVEQQAVK